MSDTDKKKRSAELTDEELDMIFAPDDDEPDVVKSVSEAFDRFLDEMLGKDYVPPARKEEGDKDN